MTAAGFAQATLRFHASCGRGGGRGMAGVERLRSKTLVPLVFVRARGVPSPGPLRRSTPAMPLPPCGRGVAESLSECESLSAVSPLNDFPTRAEASSLDTEEMISTKSIGRAVSQAQRRAPSRASFSSLPSGSIAPSSLVPRLLRFASAQRVTGRRPAGGPP